MSMPSKLNVRTKSNPTTQVTIGEADWKISGISASLRGDNSKGGSGDATNSHARLGVAARAHGLLTPHASVSEKVAEQKFNSARSGLTDDETGRSDMIFATPRRQRGRCEELSTSPGAPRSMPPDSSSNTSSSAHDSYASIGVQTSLPYSSSSYVSTDSPSRTPESIYATPRASPKRKRQVTPEYIRQGMILAQELDEDLTYISQEKYRLKRNLVQVERKERELRSLLLPSTSASGVVAEVEEIATDTELSVPQEHLRGHAPLSPANSEHDLTRPLRKPSRVTASATSAVSHRSSSSSDAAYASAGSRAFDALGTLESKNRPASIDSRMQRPGYTFAEGSSTTTSVFARDSGIVYGDISDLAPNPIYDPSTYLVWLDMETTDAVRPAANIRILEVAVLITDRNYQRIDKGVCFVVHWPLSAEEIAREMNPRVREMHEKSGLLAAYSSTPAKGRLTLAQVERRICKYLERRGIEPNREAVMAGAGVAFDRGMVRQHMEKLDVYFSHQIFDTTTLWHVIRRKYGRTKRFSIKCVHRALDDIIESSREAKLYSELVLKPSAAVHWPTRSFQGI